MHCRIQTKQMNYAAQFICVMLLINLILRNPGQKQPKTPVVNLNSEKCYSFFATYLASYFLYF